jgi:L-alanine-DL-glutamate epimerase-like enolase superfamily enzyme
MRAPSVRVVAVGGALSRAVGSASAQIAERRGLALILDDGRGARGLGEASPLPGRSGETLGAVAAALAALDGGALAEAAAALTRAALPVGAALGEVLGATPIVRALPSSARFAVETALLDLVGRRRGLTMAALLGARPDARVGLQRVVDAGEGAAALVEAARRLEREGGGALKVKIGGADFAAELAALAALRAAHPSVPLRLDANRAFADEDVAARLRLLAGVAPAFIEEPARGGLRAVDERDRGPMALAADESLAHAPREVEALLAARRLAAIVVKPMAVGGITAALAWARRASEAGAAVVVSHLWDGPIALTACAHLALAVAPPPERPRAVAGLAPHPGLDAWPPVALPLHRARPLGLSADGAGAGLGLPASFEAALTADVDFTDEALAVPAPEVPR